MRRTLAVLFAFAVLPACHDRDHNSLLVHNQGTSTVVVDLTYKVYLDGNSRHSSSLVSAGTIFEDDLPIVRELHVVITRVSGGAILFKDDFNHDDFRDDHGRIEIVVFP